MMTTGSTTGGVQRLLRLEGGTALLLFAALYAKGGYGWGYFAACFLLPDLALLGYLRGPRTGALLYNAAHSYIGPLALLGLGGGGGQTWAAMVGLIWASHIGFDRMLGYGLKYALGFSHTHLGQIGRLARSNP